MRILRSNSSEQNSKSLLQFFKVHSTKSICNDPGNQSSCHMTTKEIGDENKLK